MGDDRDLPRRFIENGHVDRALISPQPEQCPSARRNPLRERLPEIAVHDAARPWPMVCDGPSGFDDVDQCWHVVASLYSSEQQRATCWNQATSGGGK